MWPKPDGTFEQQLPPGVYDVSLHTGQRTFTIAHAVVIQEGQPLVVERP